MPSLLSLNSYHYRRGGSDVVYLDHAALFEERGWQNTFMSMQHPRNAETTDSGHFASLVDLEYSNGIRAKLRTAAATVYNFEARRRVRQLVARKSFDVAHVHCIHHHLTPSVFPVLASAGIPIVLTAHDLKVACPNYKMMNQNGICEACRGGNYLNVVRNRCIKNSRAASTVVAAEAILHKKILRSYERHVSMIVAPSRFYRDKIVQWGFDPSRVCHVPNFTREIDPDHASDYSGNILYFGRLSEEKGLRTLIRAAADAGVAVDIVGGGPLDHSLKEEARRFQAPVTFLGSLSGGELWNRVGQARAIVLPSEWYENAPMSVLEAYQLSRPVIGANIGGIPELVETGEGKAGWLFRSGDRLDLSSTLKTVSAAPVNELMARGARGRSLALGAFSTDRYFDAMRDVYASVAGWTREARTDSGLAATQSGEPRK